MSGPIEISNEVHRKTETLFSGNNMSTAGLKPPTFQSGGSSSNHKAMLPPKKRGQRGLVVNMISCVIHNPTIQGALCRLYVFDDDNIINIVASCVP